MRAAGPGAVPGMAKLHSITARLVHQWEGKPRSGACTAACPSRPVHAPPGAPVGAAGSRTGPSCSYHRMYSAGPAK